MFIWDIVSLYVVWGCWHYFQGSIDDVKLSRILQQQKSHQVAGEGEGISGRLQVDLRVPFVNYAQQPIHTTQQG